MRNAVLSVSVVAFCVASLAGPVAAAPKAAQSMSLAHSFDFYQGVWTVRMQRRKLDARLHVLSPWVSFPATVQVKRVLQGTAFVEEYSMKTRDGLKLAIGSRLYNPKTNRWAIYWTNQAEGEWQPPAVGGTLTDKGIDIVYKDSIGDQPVLTRYRWDSHDTNHPVWDQSFSNDNGKTWVANWVMSFTRVGAHT